jgi:response regulator NasT
MDLRVMLVDEHEERAALLEEALVQAGYRVAARVMADANLSARVRELKPDVVIIDTESPDRDILEHMCCLSREESRPVVMFTHDGDPEKIRTAMRAGISAYVVGGLSSERIRPIIEVAMARFQEFHALRQELERANTALAERKVVERAKGIVMKQRGCSEDEAYRALRKMAMDRGKRLADA